MSDALLQNSTPPIPANETERLAALHRYQILDTPPEAAFDRITRLAARLFELPIALISLVDESRAWFKSCIGFAAQEVPRDATLCSFAVLTDEPLIVADTRQDDRFACNPFVQQEPGVRFYAGAPLISHDGFNLGTLCLLDSQPHAPFTAAQAATLVDLAAMVVDELELRLAARKVAQVDAALLEITQGVSTVTGGAFFDALVLHFAKVLAVDYVHIGVVEGEADARTMRTIALCAQGQPAANVEYCLQETPCWEVIEQRKICCYPRNVQAHFPHAPLLKPLAIESYIAIPFVDSNDAPLGLLGVMDGKPLENVHLTESLLTLFASRIATELERQQVEQERDRFFAVASDLQVRIRSDGYFEWVSPSVERLLGWTAEEMTSRPWTEFVHSDDRNASTEEADSLFLGQKSLALAFENRYRHKDGSYRWLQWRAKLEGEMLYGSAIDITAAKVLEAGQKQAEQALRDSEERFRLMADVVPQIVWITDAQGRVEFFNQQWSSYTGVPYEPLTAADIAANFVHPDDAARTIEAFTAAQQAGSLFAIEHRVRSKTGDYRWFIVRAEPYRDAQTGEIIRWFGASLDIHDRKLTEAALQASEEHSRNILESIDDGFLALDQNWRFTYVNKAAETLLTFSADELLGKDFWSTFPGLEASDFGQLYRRVRRDRIAASLVSFYPDHDRWYEVRAYPAAQGITIYFSNVTDRIQAEAALRKSEERYRTLFESIEDGFCVLEVLFDENDVAIDHRYLEVNPAFEQQTGLTEAVGKTARQMIPNLEPFWVDVYGDVVQTGKPARFQNWLEGINRWIEVYAFRVEPPEQHKVAVLFKDITERQRTEAELHTQRQLLQTVVNYLPSSVAIVRGRDLTFQFVNPLYQAIAPALSIVGRPLQEVWPDQPFADCCDRVLATGEPDHAVDEAFEIAQAGRDLTEVRYFSWSMHRIMLPGDDGQGILISMWETTDRKRAEVERERLLQQAQTARTEAERANRLKDEFLAVLSHELRSPLNPILGWTRLLQNGKLDATRQRDALATIERNAKLQTQLIEDLLDISRIMQGKLSLNAAPVSLSFVIESAIETVRLAAEAKQIHLTLDLAADPSVSGDAARLQQVVWNLLSNAVKFTPTGGRVEVRLEGVREQGLGVREQPNPNPQTLTPNPSAKLTVTDTGKGISPDFLPHVFEYFRQEDGSTTRKFGGLGLGLAIVRQIVELHGGTVAAASGGENQGATFTVELPAIEQSLPTRSDDRHLPSPDAAPLANLQILVVDDDDDTRQFQAFVLEQSGAIVTAVASGWEALQMFDRALPDLLVSDVGMPEMDGYRLIEQIRSRPVDRGGTVLAIALTAYASEVDQQKALASGFQAHLTKPVEPDVLVKHIVRLWRQR